MPFSCYQSPMATFYSCWLKAKNGGKNILAILILTDTVNLVFFLSAFVQWDVTVLGRNLWETDLGPDICQRLSWPKKLCLLPCSLSKSRQTPPSPCWEPPMTATQKTKQKFIEVLSKWDTLGKGFQIQLRAYIWTHPCMSSWESCLTSYINLFRHFPGMQRGPDIQWRSLDKFH